MPAADVYLRYALYSTGLPRSNFCWKDIGVSIRRCARPTASIENGNPLSMPNEIRMELILSRRSIRVFCFGNTFSLAASISPL